jgi:N-acetylneuraminic acid mutarotase
MRKTFSVVMSATFLITSLSGAALGQTEPTAVPSASPLSAAGGSPLPVAEPVMPGFLDARWRKVAQASGPAAREDHTWTTDPAGDYAYLFGGRDGGKEFDDLWRYDLAADTWKKLKPGGKAPSARFGHSTAWVEGVGLVVFAGQRGVDFFNDLWAYDPERAAWKLLPDRGQTPRKRYGSCVVVGNDGMLRISHGFTFAGRFDDTRAYNFENERWADVSPDSRRPGPRCLHDCFTSVSGQMVLYGGQNDDERALGDLWVMRPNGSWTKKPDPRPRARRLYAVTEAGPNAFIFGGAGANDDVLDDLLRVDRETLEITRVRTTGTTPPGRSAGTLVTDLKRGRVLLFGGKANVAKADLWQLTERAVAGDGEDPETVDGASEAPVETVAPREIEAAA